MFDREGRSVTVHDSVSRIDSILVYRVNKH